MLVELSSVEANPNPGSWIQFWRGFASETRSEQQYQMQTNNDHETTPTNADHALRQWIEIRIQNESESRFAQIEYGPSHLRGRQWPALDRQKYTQSNPGPFPLQMQSSVLSISSQGISLRSRRQSKCGKGYFVECGLRKVVKG